MVADGGQLVEPCERAVIAALAALDEHRKAEEEDQAYALHLAKAALGLSSPPPVASEVCGTCPHGPAAKIIRKLKKIRPTKPRREK